jgi:hypothetical protein
VKRSAGLPLSVGGAPLAVRLLVAMIFFATAVLLLIGARLVPRPLAVIFIGPIGIVGLIAAAFIVAPHSRFGAWLDAFVPRLREPRVAIATAMALWLAALVVS